MNLPARLACAPYLPLFAVALVVALVACGGAGGGGGPGDGGAKPDGPGTKDGDTADGPTGPDPAAGLGPYPFTSPPAEVLSSSLDAPGTWKWIDVPYAKCRDGSQAGMYLNVSEDAPGLLLFLAGDGVCHDGLTCITTPSNAAGSAKTMWQGKLDDGLVGEDAANPFRAWTRAFVPYCTGDLFAGRREDVNVCEGFNCPSDQQFVGHRNVELILHLLAREFAEAPKVVLAGSGAGGYGTVFNYDQAARAFSKVTPTLLNDSGPILSDTDVMSQCLETRWRTLFGMADVLPSGCTACAATRGLHKLAPYLATTYPDAVFGLVTPAEDTTLVGFFGTVVDPTCNMGVVTTWAFEDAVLAERTTLVNTGRWSVMVLPEQDHIYADDLAAEVAGTTVGEWAAGLAAGTIAQVGP